MADLIEASTAAAARSALRSLSGAFSARANEIRDRLVELRMLVEATLDFPEEEVDFLEAANALGRLATLRSDVDAILEKATQGSILRNGLHVVLVGQPNVGKSSLLNRLAGEDRAIVTEVAGTTRDALRETIQIEGIPLHIIDTAGLRDTADTVERIGIERTWKEIERADVIVRLVDVRSGGLCEQDALIDSRLPAGIERLTVFNKIDLAHETPRRWSRAAGFRSTSAKGALGIELLQQELLRIAGWHGGGEDVILARERHLVALRTAREHVRNAEQSTDALELMAEELRLAQQAINEITGEFSSDDLLG